MLVSLTRVGAARQALAKGLVVQGADPAAVVAAVARSGLPSLGGEPIRLEQHPRRQELLRLTTPMTWLGTRGARREGFDALGRAVDMVASAARGAGGLLTAPGLSLDGSAVPLDGDTHWLEAADPVEQEVLCNLLRRHSPLLIAIAGRGSFVPGGRRDRVGSRWLADSHEHLAARFLASVTERHLYRVQAELRRRDGISHLDRMDIAPVIGNGAVLVRCLDAQTSLAEARAHVLLLSALALRARSMVKEGRREGHVSQRLLEENRARVISDGLRAGLAEDKRPRERERDRDRGRRDHQAREATPYERRIPARQAVRALLDDLMPEFSRLDATPEEILPLLSLVELPSGQPLRAQDLLAPSAGSGQALAEVVRAALTDSRPGGPLLDAVLAEYPGSGQLMLNVWREALESGLSLRARRDHDRPSARSGSRPDQRRKGRAGDRRGRPAGPARGGNQQ
ncbi:hypothetical protein J7E88_13950 [Streptomyces sp. ISL-10]|uniref:hypothetical protein n=1 Tax=Streptomyces sp. ISL-10 TaxID=2819172 RepID=UPI001BEA15DE|nr:hypothetical protein [Streptomyces sp. ISL-10]MBT2366377.1 hypothetical protein [Streptomyces sp. ISL-10]